MKLAVFCGLLAIVAVSASSLDTLSTTLHKGKQSRTAVQLATEAMQYMESSDYYNLRKYGHTGKFTQVTSADPLYGEPSEAATERLQKKLFGEGEDDAPEWDILAKQSVMGGVSLVDDLILEFQHETAEHDLNQYYDWLQAMQAKDDEVFTKSFKKKMYEILAAQSGGNNPMFVSHAASHGIRVMKLGQMLFNKVFKDTMTEAAQEKFGGDMHKIEVGVDILDLLHDIGYGGQPPSEKFVHALAGSEMIKAWMYEELEAALGTEIADAIIDAVHYHNYDTDCAQKTRGKKDSDPKAYWGCRANIGTGSADPSDRDSEAATWPRPIPQLSTESKPMSIFAENSIDGNLEVREYKPADSVGDDANPFMWVVRLADNLDASRMRLTPWQQEDRFMEFMFDLYTGEKNPEKEFDQCRAAGVPKSVEDGLFDKVSCRSYGPFGFLHFYSNWIVDNVDYKVSEDGDHSMTVHLHTTGSAALVGDNIVPYPAYYQINRLADAANSLKLGGGESLTDNMKVTLKNAPEGVNDKSFSLLSFSAKMIQKKLDNEEVSQDRACELWAEHAKLYNEYEGFQALKESEKGCGSGGDNDFKQLCFKDVGGAFNIYKAGISNCE